MNRERARELVFVFFFTALCVVLLRSKVNEPQEREWRACGQGGRHLANLLIYKWAAAAHRQQIRFIFYCECATELSREAYCALNTQANSQCSGGCMELATIHAHVQIYFIACSNCTPFENKFAESEVRTSAFKKYPLLVKIAGYQVTGVNWKSYFKGMISMQKNALTLSASKLKFLLLCVCLKQKTSVFNTFFYFFNLLLSQLLLKYNIW